MNILLVEDDPEARASLERSLARVGHAVVAVGSADEAEILVTGGHETAPELDVVVTDMVLGKEESGGIRVLRSLRASGSPCPVVLITAFAAVESVKLGLNEGAAYLLEKPFRAAELLEVIQRVSSRVSDMGSLVDRALSRAGLTDKEQAIARLVLKGLTSTEIARLEGNSDKTIRQHITRIYTKCGVTSRPELFHFVFPW